MTGGQAFKQRTTETTRNTPNYHVANSRMSQNKTEKKDVRVNHPGITTETFKRRVSNTVNNNNGEEKLFTLCKKGNTTKACVYFLYNI